MDGVQVKASVEITKLDPGSWPPGARALETTISGVKVAVYVPISASPVTVVFDGDQDEMYTATVHDIAKGMILAGIKNILRRRNKKGGNNGNNGKD
jgi:hypothetical protein